jgi:arylsulfatase A-like enzyme
MAVDRPNVLLLVLDSLRADRLSCYGGPPGLTPHLDTLAAGGARFTTAIAESTWTLPMALTLFTGLTPREHDGERHRRIPLNMPTLADLLRGAGYATMGATGNGIVHGRARFDSGFDAFFVPGPQRWVTRSAISRVAQPLGLADIGGASVVRSFRRWLRHVRDPWFAMLWLNDAHFPYLAPRWARLQHRSQQLSIIERLKLTHRLKRPRQWNPAGTPQERDLLSSVYNGGVAYVDSLVGQVAEELDRSAAGDDTLVVTVADHGEMLGEKGLMTHGPFSGMYQPLVHVPLIMRGPGVRPAVSPALVQLADVTQTIAEVGGVAHRLPRTAVQRLDLRAAADGPGRTVAFCERQPLSPARLARERARAPHFDFAPHQCDMTAAFADGWKLISRSTGPDELYHLAQDPGETDNVLDQHAARADFLRSQIADFHARTTPHASTTGLPPDDAEIVDQRLRDLGYL